MTNRTWDGASADWSIGSDWTPTGIPGTADIAILNGTGTYVVTIGTSASSGEIEAPGSVSITDASATLAITTNSTLAVRSLLDLAAGTLALGNAMLQGGTLELAGGTLTGNNATLDGVTVLGSLNLGYSGLVGLDIEGGFTLDTAAGTPGGTLTLAGQPLNLLDSETLDNATFLVASQFNQINAAAETLTFGSHFTLNVGNELVTLNTASFANHGTIEVASGGDAILGVAGSLFTNTGVITIAAGGSLALSGSLTTAQLQTIAAGITDHGALAIQGPLYNTGTVINAAGSLGGLVIAGQMVGGTIINGGSLAFNDGLLDGVTIWGPLVIQTGYGTGVELGVGTTLLSTTGAVGGTLVADNAYGYLNIDPGETLSHLLIEAQAPQLFIQGFSTLAFGTGLDLDVTGATEIYASASLANAGTIQVESHGVLDLEPTTIGNGGTIEVAAGGTLEIGVYSYVSGLGYYYGYAYSGAAPLLAAGSTLTVGTSLTTAQLETLLNGQTGVSVAILGTLVNTGTSLVVGSGSIAQLQIAGEVIGGAIDNVGGTVALASGGTLDGVTLLGPAAINVYGQTVDVLGGITLHGSNGVSPGSISLSGGSDAIVFLDAETLDNLTLGVSSAFFENVDYLYGSTLTIGAHASLALSGGLQISASTLTNAGTITTAGSNSAIYLYGTSIVNSGSLGIGAGDTLGIDVNLSYGQTALPVSFTNHGSIALARGAFLEMGGIAATPTLAALLGGQTGVNVAELGTLQNAGTVIDVTASGIFATFALQGDLRGGTLIGDGGSVDLAGGTLDGVTVRGSLTLGNGGVTLLDGVSFAGIGGSGPALINDPNYGGLITIGDSETLAGAAITVTGGGFSISAGTPTLSIGSTTTLSIGNNAGVTLVGTTIADAGTITAAGSLESVLFQSATIRQNGIVTIGSGDVLGLDVTPYGGLDGTLNLAGSFALAAGSTLVLGEAQTTQQLQALLSQISSPNVTVELQGTLQNTGTTLAIGAGLLGSVILDDEIIGGVITQSGGTLSVGGGTLDGVAVRAPVTLTGGVVSLLGNPIFETASGQAGGSIVAAAGYTPIDIIDAETFDNVTVSVIGGDFVLEEFYPFPLVIGAGAHFGVQTTAELYDSGGTIDNAGTLIVAPGTTAFAPSAYLAFEAATIVNTGSVSVAAGATLALDPLGSGQPLAFSNTGHVSLATGSSLRVGGLQTTAQLLTLLGEISTPGVTLNLLGTIDNTGTVLDLAAGGLLGDVNIAGTIIGGTVIEAGATVGFANTVLDNTTWDGGITLSSSNLELIGAVSVLSATGSAPGTISLAGYSDGLTVVGSDTLNQLALSVAASSAILEVTALTLGGAVTTSVSGVLTVQGQTLINAGSIAVTGQLLLDQASFVNQGNLTVSAGGVLGLGSPFVATVPAVTNTGMLSLASGSTLEVGGMLTTAQLLTLLGSLSNSSVDVELTGTLINSGATLGAATSPLLDHLILDGDIVGGVVQPGTGALSLIGGTLDGVTWAGPLGFFPSNGYLTIRDGITVQGTAGALPGIFTEYGNYAAINIADSQTLNNVSINLLAFDDQIIGTNGTLMFGGGLTLTVDNLLYPTSVDALTLGTATIVNYGTIATAGTNAELLLSGTSFINDGTIEIAAGDILNLSGPYGGGSVSLSGTGAISLANGATLEINGVETTAQLLTILGSYTHPGVTVELSGTVINTGAVLDVGTLSGVVLAADIIGGTINDSTGGITVLGGTFQNVTYEGVLEVQGSQDQLTILGSLTVENGIGGLPGTIHANGGNNTIAFEGTGPTSTAVVSNVVLQGTSAVLTILGPTNGTLDFANSFTSELSGELPIEAGTIDNAGTFLLAGTGSLLNGPQSLLGFGSNSFSNSGEIIVGPADAFGFTATQSYSNTGVITIDPGAALAAGDALTTAEFGAFIGSLATNPGVVAAIGIFGTLLNQGSTLTITPSGSLGIVGFGYASEIGGTIVNDGTALFYGPDYFQDVSWIGPMVVGLPSTTVTLIGTSSIASGSAAPEIIELLGSNDSLVFDPSNASDAGLTEPAATQQTLSNAVVTLAAQGTAASASLVLDAPGTLILTPSVTIEAIGTNTIETAIGYFGGSAVLINQGEIFSSGRLSLAGTSTIINAGVISVGGGTAESTALGITGSVLNAGLIEVSGPDRFVVSSGSFANAGSIILVAGATLDFLASVANAGTIRFADGAETLRVDAAGSVAATILDFQIGDTIDLARISDNTSIAATGTFAAGVLDIISGGTIAAALALPSFPYSNSVFSVTPDGAGGTEITTSLACFVQGTRIRTVEGDIAVEALRLGMQVPTLAGEVRPITWLGHRRVDCRKHPNPEKVWPVRVQRAAFAPATPRCDLKLSPDHAVFVDGVLIPIGALINGSTITQEASDEVTYFHVELDRHDILLAEGLACESYLDTGNRSAFANGAASVQLHPDFFNADEAWWEAAGCAKLRINGPEVLRVSNRLRRRATRHGHTVGTRYPAMRPVRTATNLADLLQPAWYLATYQDVAVSGLDAATHYASRGRNEGRLPCPDDDLLRGLGLLDPLTVAITMADIVAARMDPENHFCRFGWRERRRPNPYFDIDWYSDTYDVPPDKNPLLHYVLRGEPRGLRPGPHFNPQWYRQAQKLAPSESPLAHYLAHRRCGQVSPLENFDVVAYCRAHAVQPDRDPYAHFLATHGGRQDAGLSKSA